MLEFLLDHMKLILIGWLVLFLVPAFLYAAWYGFIREIPQLGEGETGPWRHAFEDRDGTGVS